MREQSFRSADLGCGSQAHQKQKVSYYIVKISKTVFAGQEFQAVIDNVPYLLTCPDLRGSSNTLILKIVE